MLDTAIIDPWMMMLVALAAFVTAWFHSVSGFGGGLLLAIAIAPIVGVQAVVPVIAVALLISHGSRVWVFRKGFRKDVYLGVMVTGLPCLILGAFIYTQLPVDMIAALLGIFLIITVPLRRILKKRNYTVRPRALSAVGVPFGIMAGSTVGGGLILAPFMLGMGIVGEALMGTMGAISLTVNLTKSIVFGGFDVLKADLILAGLMIGACTVPGHLAGLWTLRNTSVRVHVIVLEGVILAGGIYFLTHAAGAW